MKGEGLACAGLVRARFTVGFEPLGDHVLVSSTLVLGPGEPPAFEYTAPIEAATVHGWLRELWALLGHPAKDAKRAEVFMVSAGKFALDMDGLAGLVPEIPAGDVLDAITQRLQAEAQNAA